MRPIRSATAFRADGTKVAIVTDLGYMPELVKHHLREADFLILESNHDLDMLKVGPYPWYIKQRVMSRTGHLSNTWSANFWPTRRSSTGRRAISSWRISPSKTIIPTWPAFPPKKPWAAAPPSPPFAETAHRLAARPARPLRALMRPPGIGTPGASASRSE